MKTRVIEPATKNELKEMLTNTIDGGYNYFTGIVRRGELYVEVHYYFTGSKITIRATYMKDGVDCAIDAASYCSTGSGIVNKIAKFLNLK